MSPGAPHPCPLPRGEGVQGSFPAMPKEVSWACTRENASRKGALGPAGEGDPRRPHAGEEREGAMRQRMGIWLVVAMVVLAVTGLAGPALAQKAVKIGVLTPLSPPGDA